TLPSKYSLTVSIQSSPKEVFALSSTGSRTGVVVEQGGIIEGRIVGMTSLLLPVGDSSVK
ncbi:MAG: hypothetical protein ACPGYX_08310, partial [Oceanobacter sp.]